MAFVIITEDTQQNKTPTIRM